METLTAGSGQQTEEKEKVGGLVAVTSVQPVALEPYDPAIPLLGIYPKKMKTLIPKINTCIPMLSVALFTVAKIQKQSGVHQ